MAYTNKTVAEKRAAKTTPRVMYAAIDNENNVASSLSGCMVLMFVRRSSPLIDATLLVIHDCHRVGTSPFFALRSSLNAATSYSVE